MNPPMGPSMGTSSKGTFCATVIMTCWSLALGPSETSQSLLPGCFGGEVCGFVEGAGGPGVEDSGEHQFVFQGWAGSGFKCLQWIRSDSRTDDDVELVRHDVSL